MLIVPLAALGSIGERYFRAFVTSVLDQVADRDGRDVAGCWDGLGQGEAESARPGCWRTSLADHDPMGWVPDRVPASSPEGFFDSLADAVEVVGAALVL